MNTKLNAYEKNARVVTSGRTLEAMVLLRAARNMRQARESLLDGSRESAEEALLHNKKVWIVLISEVDDDENPLALEIKRSVISLGAFILRRTIDLLRDPKPEKFEILIQINENIASGLSMQTAQSSE